MPRPRFIPPTVKSQPDSRPTSCPHCCGFILRGHGSVSKRIEDIRLAEVTVARYRCADCGRAFRHYPEGVDSHVQSRRLRAVAALSWALGLSLRSVSSLMFVLGCEMSRMSVWRAVQEAGEGARKQLTSRRGSETRGNAGKRGGPKVSDLTEEPGIEEPETARGMGADETIVRVNGEKVVVGFVIDNAAGELLGMDILENRDSDGFLDWLEGYASQHGVETMATDAPRLLGGRLSTRTNRCPANLG